MARHGSAFGNGCGQMARDKRMICSMTSSVQKTYGDFHKQDRNWLFYSPIAHYVTP